MSLHYKANGTLDMRYSSSKAYVASHGSSYGYSSSSSSSRSSDLHYRKDGQLDMRYKSSREEVQRQSASVSSPEPSRNMMTNSDIILNRDGTVNKTCKAYRNGDILLCQDGKVDKRCAAYRQGRIILDSEGNIDAKAMNITRRSKNSAAESESRPPWFDSTYEVMEPITHRVDRSNGTERPSQALQDRINTISKTMGATQKSPAAKDFVLGLKLIKYKAGVCLNDACAICFDDLHDSEDVIVTPCKHGFHPECIKPWFKDHSECPFCRQRVPSQ